MCETMASVLLTVVLITDVTQCVRVFVLNECSRISHFAQTHTSVGCERRTASHTVILTFGVWFCFCVLLFFSLYPPIQIKLEHLYNTFFYLFIHWDSVNEIWPWFIWCQWSCNKTSSLKGQFSQKLSFCHHFFPPWNTKNIFKNRKWWKN